MNSHWIILALLLGFAIAHSGLAALRPWGETVSSDIRLGKCSLRHIFDYLLL